MRRSILVRIATSDPVRLWTGLGALEIPADAVEPEDGARYIGGGDLLDGFQDVEQLINGIAERLEMRCSGVSPAILTLARDEQAEVEGATVDIGVVMFDGGWQISDVRWAASYRADKLTIERGPNERTLSLSIASGDTGRSRSPNAYWTSADQRRRSPTDAFCDRVAGINSGTSRIFGPRE